jgi:glucose-1-phosphate thymidylyltransferase
MKGSILAGGSGTRLYPLTKVVNKNILPIYDKPLIYYPIITLRDAGIKEILIISGIGHAGQYLDLLSDGRELGVKLNYVIQDAPRGLAHGLSLTEDFAEGGDICMILADNIFEESLKPAVESFKSGAKVILKEVEDPRRFGVAELQGDKIISIEEKPQNPKSNWIVTGFYMYDNKVYDIIRKMKPSPRGEYEISDVNQAYVDLDQLTYHKTEGEWIDAGTFESLLKANIFVYQNPGLFNV